MGMRQDSNQEVEMNRKIECRFGTEDQGHTGPFWSVARGDRSQDGIQCLACAASLQTRVEKDAAATDTVPVGVAMIL